MKIYFAGSIRGGRDDRELYAQVIKLLSKYGVVLTEHVSHENLSVIGENTANQNIYERDMKWLTESDVVVAEVTTPSLGVGYEIATAEGMGKRILCLYHPVLGKSLSAMIAGNQHVTVNEYRTEEELEQALLRFFN